MDEYTSPEAFFAKHGTTEYFSPRSKNTQSAPEKGGDVQARPAAPLRITDPTTLYGRVIPDRRWIVPDWLPSGHVTLNFGDGGTGKTLLAQQLMTSCATGHPWCGLPVESSKALGIFCEDSDDELHRRQLAICDVYGLSLRDLRDMRWCSGVGADNSLCTFDGSGRIHETARFQQVRQAAIDFGARLVVIDGAADTFSGDENSRAQVRAFLGTLLTGLAQDIGGAVLLNAHPSRAGLSATGDLDGGSTAWSNSVRSRWSLARPKAEDGCDTDPDARVLTRRKANYASIGDTIRVRWASGVLGPGASSTGPAGGSAADATFMDLLARMAAEGRPVSDSPASPANYGPRIFASRPDCQGFTRRDFEAAMGRLFAAGAIRMTEYGRPGARGRPRRMEAIVSASAE
jgi:hypothetical protein